MKTLPARTRNSPLIEYANFVDGTHINLIRLNKPYANGQAYVIYNCTKSPYAKNRGFKTYQAAKDEFGRAVILGQAVSEIRNLGFTGN